MISVLSNYSEWVEWDSENLSAMTTAHHNNNNNDADPLLLSDLESVVLNKDGSVRNPLVIDPHVFSTDVFCCLFCRPLNFYTAIRILVLGIGIFHVEVLK